MRVTEQNPESFLESDRTSSEGPSSDMDGTFEVDLEKEEIKFFEKDSGYDCYLYLPSSKINIVGPRTLKSVSEFYEFDEVDACIENLDVDELKDSPKLKPKIKKNTIKIRSERRYSPGRNLDQ